MSVIFNDDYSSKRKKFIMKEFDKKLSITGGTMTGDINMGNHKIIKNSDPTNDAHLARKKYVDDKTKQLILFQSYISNSDFNFYGEIYDLPSYLKYDRRNKKIEVWYNQSRISDENFTETDATKQPIIKDSSFLSNKKVLYFYGHNKKMNLNLNKYYWWKKRLFKFFPCLCNVEL